MQNRELDRLSAVDRFLNLESSKEQELKEIVEFAAKICNTPIALVTLIDNDTQYVKVGYGTNETKTTRKDAFCNIVIDQEDVIVIPDTAKDLRFVNNPLRKSILDIQFYAGAPLITKDGLKLGSLCVVGHQPSDLSDMQKIMLATLSKQVVHILEFDNSLQIMKEQYMEAKNNEITLRSLFESSSSCLLLVDLDLNVLFYNKLLSDLMYASSNRKIKAGMSITDFIGDDNMYEFIINFDKARAGERVINETIIGNGEEQLWWQFTYEPAYDVDGNIIGVSYSSTDISELKKSQKIIIEKDQSLHAIALIQSHELRRPVASILGLINIFKINDYQTEREEVEVLERAAKELDTIIRSIVDHTFESKLKSN